MRERVIGVGGGGGTHGQPLKKFRNLKNSYFLSCFLDLFLSVMITALSGQPFSGSMADY